MATRDSGLCQFVDKEETSVMGSPKRESSEWTDEKHSLYLKSMEASFVDQLYNSLDMQSWPTQNDCSSEAMSSRKNHFMVLQHGSWSRIDFKRDKLVCNEATRPDVFSSSPWIQHFRNGNTHRAIEFPSPQGKTSLTATSRQFQQTSYSDTEVTGQNFVQEDSAVKNLNTTFKKKRKSSPIYNGNR